MFIPHLVFADLLQPERLSGLGHFEIAAMVAVPEAAVNKDYCFIFWQYQVGRSREMFSVHTIAKASCMQGFADQEFGRGVFAPDVRHHPGAGFYIDNISHGVLRVGALMAPTLVENSGTCLALLFRACGFGFRGQNPVFHQSRYRFEYGNGNRVTELTIRLRVRNRNNEFAFPRFIEAHQA